MSSLPIVGFPSIAGIAAGGNGNGNENGNSGTHDIVLALIVSSIIGALMSKIPQIITWVDQVVVDYVKAMIYVYTPSRAVRMSFSLTNRFVICQQLADLAVSQKGIRCGAVVDGSRMLATRCYGLKLDDWTIDLQLSKENSGNGIVATITVPETVPLSEIETLLAAKLAAFGKSEGSRLQSASPVCYRITYNSNNNYTQKRLMPTGARLDGLTMEPSVMTALQNAITRHTKSSDIFTDVLVRPRLTGILLHGPPGTGKTTIGRAIARQLSRPLYLLDLSTVTDMALLEIPNTINAHRNGVVIEISDIDRRNYREKLDGEPETPMEAMKRMQLGSAQGVSPGVSLLALLGFLDGTTGLDNAIIVITANNIGPLPSALVRPGRIDHIIHVGAPSSAFTIELYGRASRVEEALLPLTFEETARVRTLIDNPQTPSWRPTQSQIGSMIIAASGGNISFMSLLESHFKVAQFKANANADAPPSPATAAATKAVADDEALLAAMATAVAATRAAAAAGGDDDY
jgi:hypothetical protein